ncbi:MAG: hypothetical protein AAGE94_11400 [Acidobacteriota bacterium]
MPRPLDLPRALRFVLLFALAAVLTALPSAAQVDLDVDPDQVREALEARYEILELSRGYLLRPTDDRGDFETIEILDGRIAVDGASVDAEDLRRYVDEDASMILALAGLAEFPVPPEPPVPPTDDTVADDTVTDDDVVEEGDEDAVEVDYRRSRGDDTRVSFGTPLTIEEHESVRDVVLLLGRLVVHGEVDGDATVVGGSAEVTGQVDGSLVVVGGGVKLGPDAVIDGDVVAVGGPVRRAAGAEIDGEVIQVDMGEDLEFGDVHIGTPEWFGFGSPFSSGWDFIGNIFGIFFLLLLLLPFLFVAPDRTRAVGRRAVAEPWKSGLVGVVVEILFLPALLLVFILLMVSIVGIPLVLVVIPLLILALGIYFLMGLAGVSLELGRFIDDRFRWGALSPYLLLVLGLLLIQCWSLLGDLLGFLPWPIRISAVLLVIFGILAEYLAWTVGLGAAVLQQFSSRGVDGAYAGAAFADPYGEPPRAQEPAWASVPDYPPVTETAPTVDSERPDSEDERRTERDDEQFER